MKRKRIEIRPQTGFQESFLRTGADSAIGGGAAGSGKSWAMIFEAARHHKVEGFDAIVFRRTSPELTGAGSVWEESTKIYPHLGGYPRLHRLDWKFPSKATIKFSHMHTEADVLAHQSKAYAFIAFEEITHFSEDQFWYMVSRNRSTCGIRPYIRGTCNPDPDSFVARLIDWWIGDDGYPIIRRGGVIRWFIRVDDTLHWGDTAQELVLKHGVQPDEPKSFTFIPGRLEENKILMEKDPGYLTRLKLLPRVQRERLLGGNWKIRPAAGLYFQRQEFEIVDKVPGEIARVVRGWDKASTEPHEGNKDPDWTAGVKMAKLKDGRFIVLHVERDRGRPGKIDRLMRRTADQDGSGVIVAVYRDPGQAGKVDEEHTRKLLVGHRFKSFPATKSKITMAEPFSSQVEGGNVVLLRGAWNEVYLNELEAFPKGKHDDQVDGSSIAFKFLQRNELAHA
jgi:predicted phage terminase large subunit-like protein